MNNREEMEEKILKVINDGMERKDTGGEFRLLSNRDISRQVLALFEGWIDPNQPIPGVEVLISREECGPGYLDNSEPIPFLAAGELLGQTVGALVSLLNHLKLPEFYKLDIEQTLTYNGGRIRRVE